MTEQLRILYSKALIVFLFIIINSAQVFGIMPDIEYNLNSNDGEYLKNFENRYLQTQTEFSQEKDTAAFYSLKTILPSEILDKSEKAYNLLKKDELETKIDRLEFNVKRADYLPKLKLEIGYTRDSSNDLESSNVNSNTYTLQPQTTQQTAEPVGFGAGHNISLIFEYVIWSGGYYENQARKQKIIAELKNEIFKADKFNFQFEVMKAFYDYVLSENIIKLFRGLLDYNFENVRFTTSQITKGVELGTAIYNVKNELKQAQIDFENASRDNELARAILNTYMNESPASPILIKSDFPDIQNTITYSIDDLLKIGYYNRNELKQTDIKKLAAVYDDKIARSQYYKPRVKIAGLYGYLDSEHWSLSADDKEWKAKIIAELPLYDGGKDIARIEQAKLSIEKIRAERRHYEFLIQLEIRKNYRDFLNSINDVDMMRDRVNQISEEIKIQKVNYEKGLIVYKDFLSIQKALLLYKIKYVQAKYNYAISLLNLKKSIGLNYNVEIR